MGETGKKAAEAGSENNETANGKQNHVSYPVFIASRLGLLSPLCNSPAQPACCTLYAVHFLKQMIGIPLSNLESQTRGETGMRGEGDAETRGRGDAGTRRRGDTETWGCGDVGMRRRGDPETKPSPRLLKGRGRRDTVSIRRFRFPAHRLLGAWFTHPH